MPQREELLRILLFFLIDHNERTEGQDARRGRETELETDIAIERRIDAEHQKGGKHEILPRPALDLKERRNLGQGDEESGTHGRGRQANDPHIEPQEAHRHETERMVPGHQIPTEIVRNDDEPPQHQEDEAPKEADMQARHRQEMTHASIAEIVEDIGRKKRLLTTKKACRQTFGVW